MPHKMTARTSVNLFIWTSGSLSTGSHGSVRASRPRRQTKGGGGAWGGLCGCGRVRSPPGTLLSRPLQLNCSLPATVETTNPNGDGRLMFFISDVSPFPTRLSPNSGLALARRERSQARKRVCAVWLLLQRIVQRADEQVKKRSPGQVGENEAGAVRSA